MRNFKYSLYFSKIITISFIAIFLSLLANDVKAEKINSIVAIVNDEIITNFDVLRRTAIAIQEAEKSYDPSVLAEKRQEFYEEALKELVNREVLIQTAQKAILKDELKMDEIEKDLDSFIKGAADEVGSLSKFYEIVTQQGIDPIEKKRELRDDMMVERILKEHVYRKVSVRPKETKDYYNKNLQEFYKEQQLSFRQILIKFSEFEDKFAAKRECDKILSKINQGSDFAELAKKYSNGSHASDGGLWLPQDATDLRKDLFNIVIKLKEDELSGIIETSMGYHIILCVQNIKDSYESFKDVQDDIYQKLYREKFGRKKNEYIDKLKKDFFIKEY